MSITQTFHWRCNIHFYWLISSKFLSMCLFLFVTCTDSVAWNLYMLPSYNAMMMFINHSVFESSETYNVINIDVYRYWVPTEFHGTGNFLLNLRDAFLQYLCSIITLVTKLVPTAYHQKKYVSAALEFP